MIPPRQSTALNPLGLDFDGFLYAPVGDDQQGGMLSVISALARVGVDPWDEAASLARLPPDGAVQALSMLLERLPPGSGKPADPKPVATRLIALLPRAVRQPGPLVRATVSPGADTSPNYRLMALVAALVFALVMVTQLLLQHRS